MAREAGTAGWMALCGLLAAVPLAGCSGGSTTLAAPDRSPADAEATRLAICFCGDGYGIPGYTYADLEARHGDCASATCLWTLTERDVETYVAGREPDGRVEIVLTTEASAALRAGAPDGRVENRFGEGPFAVSLDAERLYLGLCYPFGGAAALRFPVMHIQDEDDRVRLRIGDVQGRWLMGAMGEPDELARMDPPELRALFAGLGKLEERR